MCYVNISQLTKILDISQYSIYPNLNTRKKNKNTNHKINIDKLLIESKINDCFKFTFENNNKSSFLDRITINESSDELLELDFLTAKQVRSVLKISDYELSILRNKKILDTIQSNKTRYKYSVASLLKYINDNNIKTGIKIYKFEKQFYSPQDIVSLLKTFNIHISLKSVYRYIYEYNKIPCIKVFGNLRIPILEFETNVLPNLDEIFLKFKK